jgi:hypothetical protein
MQPIVESEGEIPEKRGSNAGVLNAICNSAQICGRPTD